jgi:hypothetical protein
MGFSVRVPQRAGKPFMICQQGRTGAFSPFSGQPKNVIPIRKAA